LDVEQLITLPKPDSKLSGNQVTGTIDILDVRFGNVWTNIDRELFRDADINYGDTLEVTIHNNAYQVYRNKMTFGRSFAVSHLVEPFLYVNSDEKLRIGIKKSFFATT